VSPLWLQRGRSLSTAEFLGMRSDSPVVEPLQRGRSLSTAEFPPARQAARAQGPASTGPQSFDCGIRTPDMRSLTPRVVLQRGRSLSTAELVTRVPYSSVVSLWLQRGRSLSTAELPSNASKVRTPPGSFNGAAVFRLRNCIDNSLLRAAIEASTGPQSFDCGIMNYKHVWSA